MICKIFPENPQQRLILQVVDILRNDGVIVFPTDTIYAIGCDITCHKAVEKMAKIKGLDPAKANFSFLFDDLSKLATYTKTIDSRTFKILKKNTPGPFTFILPASSNVPRNYKSKKKTIGIRLPDSNIIREIVKELGNPIMSTSIHDDDEIVEYSTDPELIHEKYEDLVDMVIDGGYGDLIPSTIVDCTDDDITITRQGKGELIW